MGNCVNTDRYMYIEIDISKESPVAGEDYVEEVECWFHHQNQCFAVGPQSGRSCPILVHECGLKREGA